MQFIFLKTSGWVHKLPHLQQQTISLVMEFFNLWS